MIFTINTIYHKYHLPYIINLYSAVVLSMYVLGSLIYQYRNTSYVKVEPMTVTVLIPLL